MVTTPSDFSISIWEQEPKQESKTRMVHLQRPAALPARSRPVTAAAVGTVSAGTHPSHITRVQYLSFGFSDPGSGVAATCQSSQAPLCYQQAESESDLDC